MSIETEIIVKKSEKEKRSEVQIKTTYYIMYNFGQEKHTKICRKTSEIYI